MGTAQILVGDGYLQRVCGCSEPNGAAVGTSTSLACTVASGTEVFFQVVSAKLLHQITSTGTPNFATGPLMDPKAPNGPRVHAVRLTASGTYFYRDRYNPGLAGTITVP